jgi:polar amino acid transport system substrate-binding protein
MPLLFCDEAARADLAPKGTLRCAINVGNPALVQRDGTGQLSGESVYLARSLARAARLPFELCSYESGGSMFRALGDDGWDIGFLAIDPARAFRLHFSRPYLTIDSRYAVPADSTLAELAQVDRPGVRIGSSRGAAYDLHLQRTLRYASRIEYDSPASSLDALLQGEVDATAGILETVASFVARHRGVRMLAGTILRIGQSIAVPRERSAGAAFVEDFLDAMLISNGERLEAFR